MWIELLENIEQTYFARFPRGWDFSDYHGSLGFNRGRFPRLVKI